jgi:hypothetical protein
LIDALLSAAQQQGGGDAAGLSPSEALVAALTMEGLLFAAFSVGYNLTMPTREGRSKFYAQGGFGWCIVAVIGLVAAAAGASWWELFGSGWPRNCGTFLFGIGLAAGIVAQPIFAAVINYQSKKE